MDVIDTVLEDIAAYTEKHDLSINELREEIRKGVYRLKAFLRERSAQGKVFLPVNKRIKPEDMLAIVAREIGRHSVNAFSEIKNPHSQQYENIVKELRSLPWNYDSVFESEPVYNTLWMQGWNAFLRHDPQPCEDEAERGYRNAFAYQAKHGAVIVRFKFVSHNHNAFKDETLSPSDYTFYRLGFDRLEADHSGVSRNSYIPNLIEAGIKSRAQYDFYNRKKQS